MFAFKIAEVDSDRPPAGRIMTHAETASLYELLARVRGAETTITERHAADALRQMLADSLAQS